jgi:hypothetical protein
VAQLYPLGRIEHAASIVTIVGYLIFLFGCLVALFGQVLLLTAAYRRGVIWLLACILIPLVSFIFFLLHIRETWKAVALQIIGLLIAGVGYWAGGLDFLS